MIDKDPFQRKNYRAKEYGTIVIDGSAKGFDVVSRKDAERLLGEDLVGRVSGKLVVSEAVPDRPSSLAQMEVTLLNLNGRSIDEIEPPSSAPLQTEVLREFAEREKMEEIQRLEFSLQTYSGPCI